MRLVAWNCNMALHRKFDALLALRPDVAIISGTVLQERFYRRLGFVPFGPRVGTAEALYQPMYRELATLEEEFSKLFRAEPPPRL